MIIPVTCVTEKNKDLFLFENCKKKTSKKEQSTNLKNKIMALSRIKSSELPTDAVRLSEDEALAYQWKIIEGWKKSSEVWALQYSGGILAGLASATGVFVNNHYRTKLKLGNYGKFTSFLPIVAIPAMFTMLAQKTLVQKDIILNPLKECPLCLQLRSATIQTGLGVVYPTILAPFAAFMFATRHFTYRLPSITEEPLEVLKLYRRLTRPIINTLGIFCAIQAAFAIFLTAKSTQQSVTILLKMRELEEKIDEEITEKQTFDF